MTAVAYLPLSAIYSPWKWVGIGPFEVQAAFAPQYMLYFLFGLAVGSYGYDRGLLDANGMLVRHWGRWLIGSFVAFFVWIIATALVMKVPELPVAVLQVVGDLGLVTFAAAACFTTTAIFLRFANARWPVIDSISEHAYGIYFFHYLFVVWLQYALLDFAAPAIVKGLAVFVGYCAAELGGERRHHPAAGERPPAAGARGDPARGAVSCQRPFLGDEVFGLRVRRAWRCRPRAQRRRPSLR